MVSNNVLQIYSDKIWLLGLLESKIYMTWVRAIGGKMKTDYTLSSRLVYNTFPVRKISKFRKNELDRVMKQILELREYEGGSLSSLYKTDNMPNSLREKHKELDGIVDRIYQQKPFESDQERLKVLLNLYQVMRSSEGKLYDK
ncbi:type IIL restriction-modification enzyme MmeI [Vagococcus salmoninarum]